MEEFINHVCDVVNALPESLLALMVYATFEVDKVKLVLRMKHPYLRFLIAARWDGEIKLVQLGGEE